MSHIFRRIVIPYLTSPSQLCDSLTVGGAVRWTATPGGSSAKRGCEGAVTAAFIFWIYDLWISLLFFKPALQVNFEWLGAFKESGLRYEWFCAV